MLAWRSDCDLAPETVETLDEAPRRQFVADHRRLGDLEDHRVPAEANRAG
jgi:hypothetical protein